MHFPKQYFISRGDAPPCGALVLIFVSFFFFFINYASQLGDILNVFVLNQT